MSGAATRRKLFAGAGAVIMGTGISAGAAASIADYATPGSDPDAALLSLRPELDATVFDLGRSEITDGHSDEELTALAHRLGAACWGIVDAPPARTQAGRALKAAAAMYRLRDGFSYGCWPSDSEEMAWGVLSEIAGDVYMRRPPSRSASAQPVSRGGPEHVAKAQDAGRTCHPGWSATDAS